MLGVAGSQGRRTVQLIVGVDTPKDQHVTVAINMQRVRLGERHMSATINGYDELERWSHCLGEIDTFGIEGTGSYGAGVARFLSGRGYMVVEVNGPAEVGNYSSTRVRSGGGLMNRK